MGAVDIGSTRSLGRAVIRRAPPNHVRGGAGRGMFYVTCICGYENWFDALSWGGHRMLRCKGRKCGRMITQKGEIWASREAWQASWKRPNGRADLRGK